MPRLSKSVPGLNVYVPSAAIVNVPPLVPVTVTLAPTAAPLPFTWVTIRSPPPTPPLGSVSSVVTSPPVAVFSPVEFTSSTAVGATFVTAIAKVWLDVFPTPSVATTVML